MKKLFLDDTREPKDCINYMYLRLNKSYLQLYLQDWVIVRSYNEFWTYINTEGLPDLISFDHDIGDFTDDGNEITGYDCLKTLVTFCSDNNFDLPQIIIHSSNPVGRENMEKYIINYEKSLQ